MSSESIERLREIGTQKIYEQTHIPLEYVQELLYGGYEGLSKVQYLGFVSILERDYDLDLEELKVEAIKHFDQNITEKRHKDIFVHPAKKRDLKPFYIFIALIIFLAVAYFSMQQSMFFEQNQSKIDTKIILDNNISKTIKEQTLEVNTTTTNDTNDTNKTDENLTINTELQNENNESNTTATIPQKFTITARSKVWLGYIDVDTNIKKQKTFKGDFNLDPTKEWLLLFGHGHITISTKDETVKFNLANNLRILYKDGNFKRISVEEFKKLNKGRKW